MLEKKNKKLIVNYKAEIELSEERKPEWRR